MRERVAARALTREHCPYVHQARTSDKFDCVWLVIWTGVQEAVLSWNEDHPSWQRFRNYGVEPEPDLMQEGLETFLVKLPDRRSFDVGDVVWIRDHGAPRHLGIVTSPSHYVHAYRNGGRVIHSQLTPKVRRFTRAAFSYPGIWEAENG